jgi:hypothetical protein
MEPSPFPDGDGELRLSIGDGARLPVYGAKGENCGLGRVCIILIFSYRFAYPG